MLRTELEELVVLRQAHEALQRQLDAERLACAEQIAAVEDGVYGSRSWRYTAPMRALMRGLRKLRP